MTGVSTPPGREPGTPPDACGAVRLVCDVCGHAFGVAVPAYRSRSGIVECPRCGSLDLVLIDPGDDVLVREPAAPAD